MATITKSFTFLNDTEGYAAVPGATTTMEWDGAVGNPAGSLKASRNGRNLGLVTSYWQWAGTWANLGVPSDATVTGIRLLAASTRLSAGASIRSGTTLGPYTLHDSSGSQRGVLWAGRSTATVEAAWTVTSSQTAVTFAAEPATTAIQLRLADTLGTANTNGANVTSHDDQVQIEVTYTPAAGVVAPTAAPVLTATPVSDSQIDLTWTAPASAVHYDVEQDGVVVVTDTPDQFRYRVGLTPSTSYTFRVRAGNAAGDGPWSTPATASTLAPPQRARPDADGASVGVWTYVPGAPGYATINEAVPDDTSYVSSPSNPDATMFHGFRLGLLEDPESDSGHLLRYRISKDVSAGRVIEFTIRLYQGDPNSGGTQIASWVHADVSEVWAEFSQPLTTGQASAITDYANLYVRFDPTASGGGGGRAARLSWLQFETPYAALKRRTGTDSVLGSDTPTHLRIPMLRERTANDTVPIPSDAGTGLALVKRTAGDVAGTAETATRQASRSRSAGDVAGASEVAVRKATALRLSGDSGSGTDVSTGVPRFVRSAGDSSSVIDVATRLPVVGRWALDSAPTADAATRQGTFKTYLTAGDTAAANDSGTRQTLYGRYNPRRGGS